MPFDPERCKPNVLDRFWRFVDRTRVCWTWTGHRDHHNYGRFSPYKGSTVPAHRFIDHVFNGPHKPGECSLHKCDNPACVRPSHLFRGTQADNLRDMEAKGRANRTGPEKLTPEQVAEVFRLRQTGMSQREIGERVNISQTQVHRIVSGKHWKRLGLTIDTLSIDLFGGY